MTPQIHALLGAMVASAPNAETTPAPMDFGVPESNVPIQEADAPDIAPAVNATPGSTEPQQAVQFATGIQSAAQVAAANQEQAKLSAEQSADEQAGILKKGSEGELAAAENQRKADLEDAKSVAPLYADFNAQMAEHQKEYQKSQAAAELKAHNAFDDYLRTANDFAKTRPYNWWSEAGTGAKTLGIISQFLAGGLQGLTGNLSGQTPLDRVIEQDLQNQKMQMAQKSEAVGNARGVYGDLLAQLKDERAADEAFRHVAYNSVLQRAEAMKRSQPESLQRQSEAGMQTLTAGINNKLATGIVGVKQHLLDAELNVNHQDSALAAQLGIAGDSLAAERLAKEAKPQVSVPDVPGSEALSDVQRKELGSKVEAAHQMTDIADEAIRVIKTAKSTVKGISDRRRQIQKLGERYVLAVKNAETLGVLSDSDAKLARATAGRLFDQDIAFNMTTDADQIAAAKDLKAYSLRRLKSHVASNYAVNGQRLQYADPEEAAAAAAQQPVAAAQ